MKRNDNARIAEINRLHDENRMAMYEAVMAERTRREKRSLPPDVQRKLKVVEQLESILGISLTDVARSGWGDIPPLKEIGPAELAAAFREYTHDHAAVQRRRKQLDDDQEWLARDLRRLLARVEHPSPATEALAMSEARDG